MSAVDLVAGVERRHAAEVVDVRMGDDEAVDARDAHRVERAGDVIRSERVSAVEHHHLSVRGGENHAVAGLVVGNLLAQPEKADGQLPGLAAAVKDLRGARGLLRDAAGQPEDECNEKRTETYTHRHAPFKKGSRRSGSPGGNGS